MPASPPPDPRDFTPLSPQTFQILLSLHDGPLHGYAMITDIRDRTDGEIELTASTLYDALARLLDADLIEENREPATRSADQKADSRRRYYQVTALGRAVAEAEARRLERLIAMAREKHLLRRS